MDSSSRKRVSVLAGHFREPSSAGALASVDDTSSDAGHITHQVPDGGRGVLAVVSWLNALDLARVIGRTFALSLPKHL